MREPGLPVHEIDVAADKISVTRVKRTISEALMTDPVTLYLTHPEQAHDFHHAIMDAYLAEGPQMMLAVADFGCCSLLGEVCKQPGAKQQHGGRTQEEQQQPVSAGLLAAADEPSTTTEDAAVEDAAVEDDPARLVLKHRLDALARLQCLAHLDSLLEEHGAAISVHFVGAHPECQGQGLGSAILRHICQVADQRRRHLYIEASTRRSQALYARHGFEHIADKPLGVEEAAPVLRVMVRPPGAAAAATPPMAAS